MKQIIIELTAMLIFAVAAWAAWRALLLPPHGPSETILEVVAAICSILALFSLSNTVRLVWRWAMDRPEPLEEWEDIITLTDVGEE